MVKIEQDVIEILEQCHIEGDKLFLPDFQLDRKLYVKVDKVLRLAGGKWNRGSKAHLFTEDVGDTIDTLVLTGEICDIKKELQYFSTPPMVVEQLLELAEIKKDELCLEPSAGEGSIVEELAKITKVVACEIHPPFVEKLQSIAWQVYECDFLLYDPGFKYDKVVANPPFTRQQDIDHVDKMLDICCGRVVSVMSASVLFRENRKTQEFRARVNSMKGEFIKLPEHSFKESGTLVNACIVIVNA